MQKRQKVPEPGAHAVEDAEGLGQMSVMPVALLFRGLLCLLKCCPDATVEFGCEFLSRGPHRPTGELLLEFADALVKQARIVLLGLADLSGELLAQRPEVHLVPTLQRD